MCAPATKYMLCTLLVAAACIPLLIIAAVYSQRWAANTYNDDVTQYNDFVASWTAGASAVAAAWAPVSVQAAGAAVLPLAAIAGAPNPVDPAFMPASASVGNHAVAPAAYPVASNIWYNATPPQPGGLFPPTPFSNYGSYAKLTVTTAAGQWNLTVTLGFRSTSSSSSSSLEATGPTRDAGGGLTSSYSYAYFVLSSICLVLDSDTGAPAVASLTGPGCARAPTFSGGAPVTIPNRNPCLPLTAGGLSPFGYRAVTSPPSIVYGVNVTVTVRSSGDPWVVALRETHGSLAFGDDASAAFVAAVAWWTAFGAVFSVVAVIVACGTLPGCDAALSPARAAAWTARLAAPRVHPNLGRTFRHRGPRGGDVPAAAMREELEVAPPPLGIAPGAWAAAGAEQREVLLADALEGDVVWQGRDATPCLRLPLCCQRCAACSYSLAVDYRAWLRGFCICAACTRTGRYGPCSMLVGVVTWVATTATGVILVIAVPLRPSFVCQWAPDCTGASVRGACASWRALTRTPALPAAASAGFALQVAALVVGGVTLLIPFATVPLATYLSSRPTGRWWKRAAVAVQIGLAAAYTCLQVAAAAQFFFGDARDLLTDAFCASSAAADATTCTIGDDMEAFFIAAIGVGAAATASATVMLLAV